MKLTISELSLLNHRLENAEPAIILQEIYHLFGNKIAFASSLGFEDQILTHCIARFVPEIGIFTLDTGRLFPETYDLIDRTKARYKIDIRIYFPDRDMTENMVNSRGINLFYESIENRKLCCNVRKTQSLKRALIGLDAWVTGLRREQSVTRQDMNIVEFDEVNQLYKVNPLLNWTEENVMVFVQENNIPYNILHDTGFPSIGCQPCTRAITEGEDIRAGRWWWEMPDQKECGLHK
ncbi:MAG: phosphoadenylyl-sulfate reductase [Bacteroidales bacterium]|nr:phosphoadenylyl-sulfate reductase [Bacteroidales bacterium]